jgi:hypothetical protein
VTSTVAAGVDGNQVGVLGNTVLAVERRACSLDLEPSHQGYSTWDPLSRLPR